MIGNPEILYLHQTSGIIVDVFGLLVFGIDLLDQVAGFIILLDEAATRQKKRSK